MFARIAGVACCLILQSPMAGAADLVQFDTRGGEAWTYSKQVTGRIEPGACDAVVISSPAGEFRAELTGNRFVARVPLRPGTNELAAVCQRQGRQHGRGVFQVWRAMLPDAPKAWIRVRRDGDALLLSGRRSQLAPGSPIPIASFRWQITPASSATLPLGANETIRVPLPEKDGEYSVQLQIEDELGRRDFAVTTFRLSQDGLTIDARPQWIEEAVLYGVIPFFFGGFDGVRERLDEIAALGATAIWLSPVTQTTEDDFGYGPTDYFRLRHKFGDESAFRALIARAHELGLKVILDFVPNHISEQHRFSLAAAQLGRQSPYFDWFDRDADGAITHYFDWTNLNNLNYDHPEVRNHVLAAFAHWQQQYGIDGFRVDAAWGISQRAPEFWQQWRAEMKRKRPDALLLAEAAPLDAAGFDVAYDWTHQVGEWAWQDVFRDARTLPDLDRLRQALRKDSQGLLRLRFINNNDTRERFVSRYGLPYARLAALLTFTLPGVPLIFNGDEIGADFEPYDEGPPLQWRDPHGLSAHYRKLSRLRRTVPALRSSAVEVLNTSRDDRVLAFARPMPRCAAEALVLINFSAAAVVTTLNARRDALQWRDELTSQTHRSHAGRLQVTLAPHSAQVLRAQQCTTR